MTFWNDKNKNENSNASDEQEIASDEKEIYFICVCRIAFARAADLFVYLNLFFKKNDASHASDEKEIYFDFDASHASHASDGNVS